MSPLRDLSRGGKEEEGGTVVFRLQRGLESLWMQEAYLHRPSTAHGPCWVNTTSKEITGRRKHWLSREPTPSTYNDDLGVGR